MPVHEVVATLEPPKLFGLPENSWTVIEARPGHFYSDAIDSRTGNVLEPGTLSRYRDYEDRLTAALALNIMSIDAKDNVLTVRLEAGNVEEAVEAVSRDLNRFVSFAAVLLGTHLSFRLLQISQDGALVPLPRRFNWMRVHAYNLEWVKTQLLSASGQLHELPIDSRLDQALRYFAEAGSLYQLMTEYEVGRLLEPACFLQFWKAIATIAGDPSADRDHQSRCRRFGLGTQYYEQEIRPLHGTRNSFDVAHMAPLDAPAFVRRDDVEKCRRVASELIRAYVGYLRSQAAIGAQQDPQPGSEPVASNGDIRPVSADEA